MMPAGRLRTAIALGLVLVLVVVGLFVVLFEVQSPLPPSPYFP
jgi:hypothetical protein